MKKQFLFLIAFLMLGFTGMVNAQDSQKKVAPVDPLGKWDFQASDAPYGYEKGQFVITEGEENTAPKVKIVFNEYSKTDGYKVKYENNKLSFTVYVEDESVYVTGNFEKDTFKGKASTSMGDIAVTGKRHKDPAK
jgi:hypothetical protein